MTVKGRSAGTAEYHAHTLSHCPPAAAQQAAAQIAALPHSLALQERVGEQGGAAVSAGHSRAPHFLPTLTRGLHLDPSRHSREGSLQQERGGAAVGP
jgi:hypothetical protein